MNGHTDFEMDDSYLVEAERRTREAGKALPPAAVDEVFAEIMSQSREQSPEDRYDQLLVQAVQEGANQVPGITLGGPADARDGTGKEAAFEDLFEHHYPLSYAIAYGYARNAVDAESLAFEAWEKVARALHTFDRTRKFQPWLRQIVVRVCIDDIRKRKSRDRIVGELRDAQFTDSGKQAVPGPFEHDPGLRLFYEAWDSLSDDQRDLLWLRFFAGFTLAEIAEEYPERWGTTHPSVGNHERRALAAFAECLKEVGFAIDENAE
jgi:RNA polymerase sigma-70 factor (ECF subfamily)